MAHPCASELSNNLSLVTKDAQSSVSVVIPTLGRNSLVAAVESALSQTKRASEVIVVDASTTGVLPKLPNDPILRVLRHEEAASTGKWTAAHNRNFGVRNSSGDFIAFLDDDDLWKPNKLEVQLDVLRESEFDVLATAVEFVLPSGKTLIRPDVPIADNEPILEALYGRATLRRNRRYVATPSLLMKREVAVNIPQNEDIPWFEDTWWLHEVQSQGYRFHQISDISVIVMAEPLRSIQRDSLEKIAHWCAQLDRVDSRYSRNYASGIALRNFSYLGRTKESRALIKALRSQYKLSMSEHLRCLSLLLLSVILNGLQSLRVQSLWYRLVQ